MELDEDQGARRGAKPEPGLQSSLHPMVSGEDLADCSGNLPEIVLRFCIFVFRCLIEFWLFVVSGDESHLPQAPRVGNHGLANEEAWAQIIHHCSRWFPRLFESKEWWENSML